MNPKLSHKIVRTPIDTINIFGAGGIRQSSIVEIYGLEKSGKSTCAYQTGALFQKDNMEGIVHIIDVENSVDYLRLREVFKFDMDRVKVHHCRTLEQAFNVLNNISQKMEYQAIGKFKDSKKTIKLVTKEKLLEMEDKDFLAYCEECGITEKDRKEATKELVFNGYIRGSKENGYVNPVLAIWDTIAVSKPQAEYDAAMSGDSAMNAGGIGMKARVIELYACTLLASMGGKPFTVLVLNQVRLSGFGSYTGPQEGSSGGNALKHNCHYRFKFTQQLQKAVREENYDDKVAGKMGTVSIVNIEKAKYCPITEDIRIYINDQLGGLIVPKEELAHLGKKLGLITDVRGPAFMIKGLEGKYVWNKGDKGMEENRYISNNPEIRNYLLTEITKHYRISYHTLDHLYKDVGLDSFGKPSEEEMMRQETIEDQQILKDMDANPFALQ